MKKFLTSLLVLVFLVTFGLFAIGSGSESENETADQGNENAEVEATVDDTKTLGDYEVDIKSCRLAKDFEGKDIVIVTYGFTNVKDDNAAAFYIAMDATVYQNGVGLNESYFADDSANYNADNQTKEIKKGASIDVEVAYELNDTTTDIEVEVSEFISLDEKVLTKTFTIA